jgi:uncharacterized membrane protein YbhN (UPF0104 family)
MALALAAAVVLVWIGRRNAHDLSRVHLRLQAGWLLASLPPYALGSLLLAVGWRTELAAFGHRLPVGVAIRVWWRAQLARYVPTGLAAFASRAALARQEGVPASLGAASLAVELATLILWGTLGAAVGITFTLPLRVLLGVSAAIGLVLLPLLYRRVASVAALGRRFPALAPLATTPARTSWMYAAIGCYGLSILVKSVAFVLFSAALLTIHPGDAWLLGGAVQGAAVIGIIGITPAGIGVRETAMVGLLSHRFGTTDAAALAIAWRAYEFAFELVWLAIGSGFGRRTPATSTSASVGGPG